MPLDIANYDRCKQADRVAIGATQVPEGKTYSVCRFNGGTYILTQQYDTDGRRKAPEMEQVELAVLRRQLALWESKLDGIRAVIKDVEAVEAEAGVKEEVPTEKVAS